MTLALVLVDLQEEFLAAPELRPPRAELLERVAALLGGFRAAGLPVVHVWTTLRREPDTRLRHWREAGRWPCLEGSAGHATPAALAPAADEWVVHKSVYSPFVEQDLAARLRERGVGALCLAGVHLHACVRATALDAYQRGFAVCIAEDAVASREPGHGDWTARYLARRAVRFLPVHRLLAEGVGAERLLAERVPSAGDGEDAALGPIPLVSPRDRSGALWRVPATGPLAVRAAAREARDAQAAWAARSAAERGERVEAIAARLAARGEALADQLAVEVGKPRGDGLGEVAFGAALVRAAGQRARRGGLGESGAGWTLRRRPLGVIGVVTPWNNPLAIPLGKLAPALLYGNAVLWKPAPAGTGLARTVLEILGEAGLPPGLVQLVTGDRVAAEHVMGDPGVDAVTLTGGEPAGRAAQAICAARHVPLQAELGGNNAAVVWDDADLERAAAEIAAGAFGFAGQRCTANRRAVVAAACQDRFLEHVLAAADALVLGDPLDPATRVGPLISEAALGRVRALLARARAGGLRVVPAPGAAERAAGLAAAGFYHPPTVVVCDEPGHELVQEETFGPVLVVQPARDFEQALALCNGVRQGLAAALFSASAARRERFLAEAQAGILKLEASTAGAEAEAPFPGWKASGVGPPEHGAGDAEFYTRPQTVYGAPARS